MRNLTKIVLALALTFGNIQSISNSYLKNDYAQNKIKKDYYEKTIKEIFPKMDSIRYAKDIKVHGIYNFWQTPKETDSLKTGDCEDEAIYVYNYLTKKGLDIKLIKGLRRKEDYSVHIWNEYKIGYTEYIIETTFLKDKSKIIKKDTINLSENYMPLNLTHNDINIIKDFEDYSGIDLIFNNPTKYSTQ